MESCIRPYRELKLRHTVDLCVPIYYILCFPLLIFSAIFKMLLYYYSHENITACPSQINVYNIK